MYEYVKEQYGVNPIVGDRVKHILNWKFGRIVKEDKIEKAFVQVHFEGGDYPVLCHPKEIFYCQHDLYENSDENIPKSIQDQNGDVVLDLCKLCNKGEIELQGPCIKK